jgi:hypothetical protein
MLSTVLLPFIIASHNVPAEPVSFAVVVPARLYQVAAGPRKGPGPDHGDDPHDEQHDGDIPGNAHKWDGHPSGDPYGGTTPNDRNNPNKPYPD